MSSPDQATPSELGARFFAAAEDVPTFESEQMLAQLGERMFGIQAEPLKLGRYSVLRRIGAGGMGVVYLGYDGELDRKVALKLLRLRSADADGHASARLVREARALARVDHPHVIAVHEVGSHEGAVFLAMDLVEGVSLEAWQRERPRPWRALVEIYIQAGRGLAAAHAAGVIHRDFKPANVLIGDDGRGGHRARVVDFGLARAAGEQGDEVGPTTNESRSLAGDGALVHPEGTLGSALTATGALLGTPAYMAPEQLLGGRADARSDQFSFALGLHEALCGQRAFAGDSVDALRVAVLAGHRRPLGADRRAPRWLHRILDRALELAPERRHPSMQALLDQL
ncbi:MAG: serine/threonine protein kinase, partial [Nannocystis sp.]